MIKVDPKINVFCGDCWYHNRIPNEPDTLITACGICRRSPPTAMVMKNGEPGFALYPVVRDNNPICGEFVEVVKHG